jgi:hypothetical protein
MNDELTFSPALEFIKSKHNGEIPYKYGANECAKMMTDFAEAQNKELIEDYEEAKDISDENDLQFKVLEAQNKELLKERTQFRLDLYVVLSKPDGELREETLKLLEK